jgi:hypothetical protein
VSGDGDGRDISGVAVIGVVVGALLATWEGIASLGAGAIDFECIRACTVEVEGGDFPVSRSDGEEASKEDEELGHDNDSDVLLLVVRVFYSLRLAISRKKLKTERPRTDILFFFVFQIIYTTLHPAES